MPRRLAWIKPNRVEVVEYEDRELREDEVLIETEYASGKHGTTLALFDNVNFRGKRFDQSMRLFIDANAGDELGESRDAEPQNLGTTGVGTVVKVGPGVTRWKEGDRVFGLMDVRETNICKAGELWELGDIDPLEALCIEPAYVAFHAMRESNVRYGDAVAVIGLGAIGLLAVQMAHQSGADVVIAVDPFEKRREWARRHGAHFVLDPSQGDPALEIHTITGGPGVDVAIECAGRTEALQIAIRSTRMCGTVCSVGFYQGESKGLWLGREWHHNRLTMVVPHGCGWGHPPRDYPRWTRERAYDAIISLMRQGKLRADGLIDPVVPLEQGPEVFRLIQENPGQVVKYAVRF